MDNHRIEIFLPFVDREAAKNTIGQLNAAFTVDKIWLWSVETQDCEVPCNAELLPVPSLTSTALFCDMASRATADYVLCLTKEGLDVDCGSLQRLLDSFPAEAAMAYADYRKIIAGELCDAPVIDCFAGSLRNDFDFGSLLLFRTSALKNAVSSLQPNYEYAGLYQLRLAMSRQGSLYHFGEYLYTETELDTRKSGEKQFDYVNPAQRAVQVEMEAVCTAHLKAIGAWLPSCKYRKIDLSIGDFPVEASVIIPVLNRESTIADAIGSVLSQVTTFPFNILVVDNHSTDSTPAIIDSFNDGRVVHIVPERTDLGIGGCWDLAVKSEMCGRFAVQLDSDDLYSDKDTLQRIVDAFYEQQCAMLVGSYRICDFELNTLPPGVIDHREWSEENGRNNALRINGLGAPRAFFTPIIREVGFPNVSYGEDYAVGLRISREYKIGRIYDVLYLCRRWGGNSDAALSHEKQNTHNLYKDSIRTSELEARMEMLSKMSIPSLAQLNGFFEKQLAVWPSAADRFAALDNVQTRDLGNGITLQYNPARIVSTGAGVDKAAIAARACFLCAENRPDEQYALEALGTLDVLVNPFPILPFHLTLPLKEHTPQLLKSLYVDMLHLSRHWQGIALFYNGAECGASAPDHAHLQAVRCCDIPLLSEEWSERVACGLEPLYAMAGSYIYMVDSYIVPLFVITAGSVSASVELLNRLLRALPCDEGKGEPRMNVIVSYSPTDGYVTTVIPRSKHRPAAYSVADDTSRLVSPGTLDMSGLVITPRESDFLSLTADEAYAILCEVALSREEAAAVAENVK